MVILLSKSMIRIVLLTEKVYTYLGMLENSVIVFTTDNGGPAAGFNQNAASNWPLKGVSTHF